MKKQIGTIAMLALFAAAPLTASADEGLAKSKACLACHQVQKKVVGPAFKDVAAKYKGDSSAAATLAVKIKAGGKGGGSPFAAAVLAAAVNARYPGLAATGPCVLAALAVDLRRQYASKGKAAAAAVVPVEDAVTALMSGGEEMTQAQAVRAGELFGLDVVCMQHSSKTIEPASRERPKALLVLLCNGKGELIGFAADASDALLWVA